MGCALFLLPVFPAHCSSADNIMLFNLGWARTNFLSAVELSYLIVCFFTFWQGSGSGPGQLFHNWFLAHLSSWTEDRRHDYDGQAVHAGLHLSKRNAPIRRLGLHFDLASNQHAFQGPLFQPLGRHFRYGSIVVLFWGSQHHVVLQRENLLFLSSGARSHEFELPHLRCDPLRNQPLF